MTTATIWTGTVDNLELSGQPNGDQQPMRVVEGTNGQLMTEFAFSTQNEAGEIEYDTTRWIADSGMRFRDMESAPDAALVARMQAANLLEEAPCAQ